MPDRFSDLNMAVNYAAKYKKSSEKEDESYLAEIVATIERNGQLSKFFDLLEGQRIDECLPIKCDTKRRIKVRKIDER